MSKKKKIIIGLCFLATIVLAFVGGNVLAKYQSTARGDGRADIAKWEFNVNGNSQTVQTIEFDKSYDKSTLTNGRIAPGTKGAFDIVIEAYGSDVGIDYTVAFFNERNKPANLKFKYGNEEVSTLEELSSKLSGRINANDGNKMKILPIEWEWAFESGDDIADTNTGIANLDYTFDVAVTGTQVRPQ